LEESVSAEELQLLARLIEAESAAESLDGKVAVGAVVLNRLSHNDFPATIQDIIYQKGQFECVSNGALAKIGEPSEESVQAATKAFGGEDPTDGALFFFNPQKTKGSWFWQREQAAAIGNHVFVR
jgi:N-acetylmuramoyl-L-alanine amidase